jgi:hypothetical protein
MSSIKTNVYGAALEYGLEDHKALPAHALSQQLLLTSQLQRHPARVLVRGCHHSLKLMLELRSRTVLCTTS